MTDKTNLPIEKHILETAAKRVAERCDALAKYSEHPQQITRTFGSPAMKQAHDELRSWMESTGLQCRLDAVGNLIGRLNRSSDQTFLIGSHLDTVVNAGRFDGVLGVLLGLAVAEVALATDTKLPFNLDVVGFSEEEGVRFSFPFIGSLGIVGDLEQSDLDRVDADSVTMREALVEFGCDVNGLSSAQYDRGELVGFMEAHIEQADLLQEDSAPVGVVSAIAGQTRASIVFVGVAGHSGTVLHDRRKDALTAAAELILEIEKIGQTTDGLFATVGRIKTEPGLSNVISGRTTLSLDLRHEKDEVRDLAFEKILLAIKTISKQRSVVGELEDIQHNPAVPMDGQLINCLAEAIGEVSGAAHTKPPMVSGAGHDAMIMARATGSCMLFVRCRDGISHHPAEFVSAADIEVALEVMVRAVFNLADSVQT